MKIVINNTAEEVLSRLRILNDNSRRIMMGLNSQIHLKVDTELYDKLQNEADELGMTFSELCRFKLGKPSPLNELISEIRVLNKKLVDK